MTFARPVPAAEWVRGQVGGLPVRWAKRLTARWERSASGYVFGDYAGAADAERRANIELSRAAGKLAGARLELDASDASICAEADRLAAKSSEFATVFHTLPLLRGAMGRLALAHGLTPPNDRAATCKGRHVEDGPAVARLSDPLWWRRQLRKVHGRQVEGAAIDLGYVNKSRDPYVSNESVFRRAQQNERNAATLDGTIATNENGQEYTLAELAATGPANKAIRRGELMTRIAGFERIAVDLGHAGLFMTVTCPSRMHKWRTVAGGRVMENPKYDGTLPGAAQKYLAGVWALVRAACSNVGIKPYGFRIAEPNHDGTPHWHVLVFLPADRMDQFRAVVLQRALKDSPNERGAAVHRVDFKPIDQGRGSAAGYIAKYVAKNIDGYRLDKDLIGNDAVETSHRVEAWASTWGIRQFQQIGGPPVGPWRELRRVAAIPEGAPDHLKAAHHAVNKITDIEAGTVKSVSWAHYVNAQGGVFCGRGYRVRVTMIEAPEGDTSGRYGEAAAPKAVGVETTGREFWTPAWMAHMGGKSERVTHWFVESKRYTWTIARKRRGCIGGVRIASPSAMPWTCVNNCTAPDENRADMEVIAHELRRARAEENRVNGVFMERMTT